MRGTTPNTSCLIAPKPRAKGCGRVSRLKRRCGLRGDPLSRSRSPLFMRRRTDTFPRSQMACSSVVETAAEKLVALGWRAGSELAGLRKERDPTLVRHIYDLHMIRAQYDAAETARLAQEVMKSDAET